MFRRNLEFRGGLDLQKREEVYLYGVQEISVQACWYLRSYSDYFCLFGNSLFAREIWVTSWIQNDYEGSQ